MQPHDPNNTKRPTKFVGGAGKYNKRGAKSHKSKGQEVMIPVWKARKEAVAQFRVIADHYMRAGRPDMARVAARTYKARLQADWCVMHTIYIVQHDREDKGGHYHLFDSTERTLEASLKEVERLYRSTGKCYGIVDANGVLVHESSKHYASLKLKVRKVRPSR